MLNILLVAAECAPLSKTGGLADVVGTLPSALNKLGNDARVITPYHRCIKEKYRDRVEHMFHFFVDLGWRHQYAGIERLELDGVTIYLVDSEYYYGDKIYRGGYAEGEQYAFFCRAVLDAMPNLGFDADIIHCNDWHTSMIPMLAKTQYSGAEQENKKYLLSIHNIMYQGKYDFGYVQDLLGVDEKYYTPEFMELNGCASFLKGGCVFADKINTVSPTYAEEIKTPYFGEGLDGLLNARSGDLWGILNGIDVKVFNPSRDKLIPKRFTAGNLKGKAECKKSLQKSFNLPEAPDVPVVAMVTRMTEQKGFDLVMYALDSLMNEENLQFVLLGTGDEKYENFMNEAAGRYHGRVGVYIGYSEELSHLVYAGSDLFLMPSRFEPCGLSQMIAMRYGSLPIVRETGGLKDSVNSSDGFTFCNYNALEMKDCIASALRCYEDKNALAEKIANAMKQDFSFARSAKEYVSLYKTMLPKRKRARGK